MISPDSISPDSGTALEPKQGEPERPTARISVWAAVVVWVGVIFFSSTSLASKWAESAYQFVSGQLFGSSSSNLDSFDLLHLVADKGFHVSLFCVFALLLWLALPPISPKPSAIVLCGALVGSCSEFLQRFFPDRDPAIRDVLINIGGTFLGVLICLMVARIRRRTKLPSSVSR